MIRITMFGQIIVHKYIIEPGGMEHVMHPILTDHICHEVILLTLMEWIGVRSEDTMKV